MKKKLFVLVGMFISWVFINKDPILSALILFLAIKEIYSINTSKFIFVEPQITTLNKYSFFGSFILMSDRDSGFGSDRSSNTDSVQDDIIERMRNASTVYRGTHPEGRFEILARNHSVAMFNYHNDPSVLNRSELCQATLMINAHNKANENNNRLEMGINHNDKTVIYRGFNTDSQENETLNFTSKTLGFTPNTNEYNDSDVNTHNILLGTKEMIQRDNTDYYDLVPSDMVLPTNMVLVKLPQENVLPSHPSLTVTEDESLFEGIPSSSSRNSSHSSLDDGESASDDASNQMSGVTTGQTESQTQYERVSNVPFTGSIGDLLNPSVPVVHPVPESERPRFLLTIDGSRDRDNPTISIERRLPTESPSPVNPTVQAESPSLVEPTVPLESRGVKRRRSSGEEEFDPQVGPSKRRKSDEDSDSDPKSGPGFGGSTGGIDPGASSGPQDTSGPSSNFRDLAPKEIAIYLFSFLSFIIESFLDVFL